jgi:putative transposase
MTAGDLKEIMETVLPESVLRKAVKAAGFEQRERKRDALKFIRAMLASAASPSGGRQADIMRTYFENGAPRVARGSFYDWFGPALEEVMTELAQITLQYAQKQPLDLPGMLGRVKDWRIVDSTTVRLHDSLKKIYPGTGDYAALKLHKTLSVGYGTVVDYHMSPAREHDSPHLKLDESWRDMGLLTDLGYASMQRLRDCQRFGVSIIMRLKSGWKPKVQRIVRGHLSKTFVPGTDLELVLDDPALILGNCIDADVTVGADAIPMRLIGVLVPNRGYFFYLTNLPRTFGPRQVADLYRVRWEIETNNKLDKSSHRLSDIDARKPAAVHALIHATMISSMLVGLIVHRYNLAVARRCQEVRTEPPLHHGLVARTLSTCSFRIAEALELEDDSADAAWEHLVGVIVHTGKDPNWRSKPSVLDQLRGWRPVPARPTKRARQRSTA